MSLIKCLECGKDISDKALNCPHCGIVRKKTSNKALYLILLSITLFIFCLAVIMSKISNNAKQEFLGTCLKGNPKQETFCLCVYNYIDENYGTRVFFTKEVTNEIKGIIGEATTECIKKMVL